MFQCWLRSISELLVYKKYKKREVPRYSRSVRKVSCLNQIVDIVVFTSALVGFIIAVFEIPRDFFSPGVGACHIALGAACLGTYSGVGAFHSTRQNSYLGAYPGVGAYPGYYCKSSARINHKETLTIFGIW